MGIDLEQLKEFYAREVGFVESKHGDYRVDVIRGDLLIEIQTGSFSNIRDKLRTLSRANRVRLVHPIADEKWIIKINSKGEKLSKRKSPKRGRIEEIFYELVYLPKLLMNTNFELEVVTVNLEEYWIDDGKGSWRRKRWSIHDKKMLELTNRWLFSSPRDFLSLIPDTLPSEFTSIMLAKELRMSKRLSQKMLYCLAKMEAINRIGRKGKTYLYKINHEV